MKELITYLKESIFDSENDIFNKVTDNIYNELLVGTDFVVAKDDKHIVYSPEVYFRGYRDRTLHFYNASGGISKNLDKLSKTDLIFQPLYNISIDDCNINAVLSKLKCESTANVSIELYNTYNGGSMDFSKINFPVLYSIDVKNYGYKGNIDIIAYNEYVPVVKFIDQRNSTFTPDNIKGWDCGTLIISGTYFRDQYHADGTIYGFNIDKIQSLIDNNPKAKTIVIYDEHLQKYWKINTKTSKRKLNKLVNKRFDFHKDEFMIVQNSVMDWESEYKDIIPNRLEK